MSQQSVQIINQLFELQSKLKLTDQGAACERNFTRLFNIFEEAGYLVQDPTNEAYNDARTDCEANLVGSMGSSLQITKTLKPIIYQQQNGSVTLVQKAVVIVEKK